MQAQSPFILWIIWRLNFLAGAKSASYSALKDLENAGSRFEYDPI
jgi:hypothetical protein